MTANTTTDRPNHEHTFSSDRERELWSHYDKLKVPDLRDELARRVGRRPSSEWRKHMLVEKLVELDLLEEQERSDHDALAAALGTFQQRHAHPPIDPATIPRLPEEVPSQQELAQQIAQQRRDAHADGATGAEVVPVDTVPSVSVWDQLTAMARFFCTSQLVPKAIRESKTAEADCALIFLKAHDLGIPMTDGLEMLHVIDGKVGMAAQLMARRIIEAGHELRSPTAELDGFENDKEKATVIARRKGATHEVMVSFTMEEANRAGLPQRSRPWNKKLGRRADSGGTWDNFPEDMLWWRAIARLARRYFPDVLGSVRYTPDELGEITETWGEDLTPPPAVSITLADGTVVPEDGSRYMKIGDVYHDAQALGFERPDRWHEAVAALRQARDAVTDEQRGRYDEWRRSRDFAWPWSAASITEMGLKLAEVAADDDYDEAELAGEDEDGMALDPPTETVTGATFQATLGADMPATDDALWTKSAHGRDAWGEQGVSDVHVALANEADGYAPGDPGCPM